MLPPACAPPAAAPTALTAFLPTPRRRFTGDPVTAQPDVTELALQGDDEFVIVASDGLWDVMDSQEVAKLARRDLQRGNHPQVGLVWVCGGGGGPWGGVLRMGWLGGGLARYGRRAQGCRKPARPSRCPVLRPAALRAGCSGGRCGLHRQC